MSARDAIFRSIRNSLGVSGHEAPRIKAVADRLSEHPSGVLPRRGQLPAKERVALFMSMVEAAAGSVAPVDAIADVPAAVGAFLRQHDLPLAVRCGADAVLAAAPWAHEAALQVTTGPSDGRQLAAVSRAFAGVAETGTVVLTSGADNPTTLNFLPDNHIVVIEAKHIAGDYETVFARLRRTYGAGRLPRAVNLITGPSRSADIEQTLILGAHGPRRLHVIVVGKPGSRAGTRRPAAPR